MARGQQKIQSQAKAQKKSEGKNKGHNLHEQKKAAAKALVHACPVCKVGAQPQPRSISVWKCVHTTSVHACIHYNLHLCACRCTCMHCVCVLLLLLKCVWCVCVRTHYLFLCV